MAAGCISYLLHLSDLLAWYIYRYNVWNMMEMIMILVLLARNVSHIRDRRRSLEISTNKYKNWFKIDLNWLTLSTMPFIPYLFFYMEVCKHENNNWEKINAFQELLLMLSAVTIVWYFQFLWLFVKLQINIDLFSYFFEILMVNYSSLN